MQLTCPLIVSKQHKNVRIFHLSKNSDHDQEPLVLDMRQLSKVLLIMKEVKECL